MFTNFGAGFTIVLIDGPFVVTRDIVVAFFFITAPCRILLYFPLLRICHKHIDVKMFIYFYKKKLLSVKETKSFTTKNLYINVEMNVIGAILIR